VQPRRTGGVIPCTLRSKPYLFLTLVLALVAAATLAWRQYQELVVLRASALSSEERAALEARLAEFKKSNFDLQAQLAALQLDKKFDDATAADTAQKKQAAEEKAAAALAQLAALTGNDPDGQSKKDEAFELLGAMADTPEFQKLLALEQRGKVDAKFAALFKRLKLSPDEQAKLEELLVDKQSAYADAMIAAHGQGLSGKDAKDVANAIANSTQKQIDGSIKDLLGQQRYNQYQNYQQTMPQREAVNQLAQQLSYTATPLSAAQQDRLVNVLATTAAAPKTAAGTPPAKPVAPIAPLPGSLANLGVASAPSAPITTAAVVQSQTFLAPQQVAALQQMQQQQQAQQTLNKVLSSKPATTIVQAPKPGK
jgi:hypothetical protein